MSVEELEKKIRACTQCAALFAGRYADPLTKKWPLVPKPIFAGASTAPVMLVGQAPGLKEYERAGAFQGQAGEVLRGIFSGLGLIDFDRIVYQTSVTKCFPGRKVVVRKSGKNTEEDNVPSRQEISNCLPYLSQQIAFVRPRILIPLGGTAIKAYCELRFAKHAGNLKFYVGRCEDWDGMRVIFFPHTSGSSRWLNDPDNRRRLEDAKRILAHEIRVCGVST